MDIQSYAAYKQRFNIKAEIPDLVIIDEAQNVFVPEFQRMFEMARSAGIGILVAHQSKQQFDQIQRGLFENIFNNTNLKFVLGIDDPETTKYLAEFAGQELKYFSTETRAGANILKNPTDAILPRWIEMESERYDYRIRPEEFQNLGVGEAYVFCADPPIKGVRGKLNYFAVESGKSLEKILPRKKEDKSWKDREKGLCLLWEFSKESEFQKNTSAVLETKPQLQKGIEDILDTILPIERKEDEGDTEIIGSALL